MADLLVNKGISRANRFPASLDSSLIALDDRDFSDLMNMALEFSSLLKFYDKNDSYRNYWNEFFLRDNLFILSSISKTDYQVFQKNFDSLSESYHSKNLNDKMKRLLLKYNGIIILQMAKLIDTWYINFTKETTKKNLFSELRDAIQSRLSSDINIVNQWKDWATEKGIMDEEMKGILKSLDSVWNIKNETTNRYTDLSYDDVLETQRNIFRNFYDSIIYLVRLAPTSLNASLSDLQDHTPHIALFVTFLKLFRYAQDKMNNIVQRHLDFYYKEVLRQEKKKPAPDSVFLSFTLNDGYEPFLLKSGNKLRAGKDKDGQDILYKTTDDLIVSKAFVKQIKTLFTVSGQVKNQVSLDKICIASFDPKEMTYGWPTIGGNPEDFMDPTMVHEPTLGFMLAAPIWSANEGKRAYQVTIGFDAVTGNLDQLKWRNVNLSPYFQLYLTGKDAWIEIKNLVISQDINKIVFSFELGADIPPVVSNDKLFSSGKGVPVLKVILLSGQESDSPVVYLQNIIVNKIDINLKVKGLSSMSIFNKYGKIDASKPFQPFGPAPERKDYFVAGNYEVFAKKPSSVSFYLQWDSLPEENFAQYYQAYGIKTDNSSFKVKLSLLRNGNWFALPNDTQSYSLFEVLPGKNIMQDAPDSHTSWEGIDLSKVPDISEPVYGESAEDFNNYTRNDFFRFELTEPDWAFGHAAYPQKFAEISYKNNVPEMVVDASSGKIKEYKIKTDAEKVPFPNLPYTPTLSLFSVDYEANEEINIQTIASGTNGFFQLMSFGYKELKTTDIDNKQWALFNNYTNRQGCLYIGLSDFNPPETLTFFFKLEEELVIEQKGINSSWAYLADDEWKPILNDQHIVLDTTGNLSHSGIIKMDIPGDITNNNRMMPPDGCYWLRFTSPKGAYYASWTYGIHIHAVIAQWDTETNHDYSYLANPLPPGSIGSLVEVAPAIAQVMQPYYSFGNQGEETEEDYYMRVSERLRHKQRAVSSYDYERLVLERFSFVNKVVCFQATKSGENQSSVATPGSVVLVVTQFIKNKDMIDPSHILVNSSNLNAIKEYVQQYCSAFVNVEVKNPLFERLKVEAGISFSKGCNNKYYLNKLSDELNRFLCPWLYDDTAEVNMGEGISLLDILGFIEKREYVDGIGSMSVYLPDSDGLKYTYSPDNKSHKIEVKSYWSVLIPDEKHQFTILNNA